MATPTFSVFNKTALSLFIQVIVEDNADGSGKCLHLYVKATEEGVGYVPLPGLYVIAPDKQLTIEVIGPVLECVRDKKMHFDMIHDRTLGLTPSIVSKELGGPGIWLERIAS